MFIIAEEIWIVAYSRLHSFIFMIKYFRETTNEFSAEPAVTRPALRVDKLGVRFTSTVPSDRATK